MGCDWSLEKKISALCKKKKFRKWSAVNGVL
jgi:hypothetical protein